MAALIPHTLKYLPLHAEQEGDPLVVGRLQLVTQDDFEPIVEISVKAYIGTPLIPIDPAKGQVGECLSDVYHSCVSNSIYWPIMLFFSVFVFFIPF